MTLEESLKALKAAFTSKSGEAEAMAKEMSELKAKNETLSAEYAALAEKFEASAAVIGERDAAVAKVEELTKSLAASEALKAEATKQIESVGKVAAKIAASVGVKPVEGSPADAPAAQTGADLWKSYCEEKDPAKKMEIYNKNRSAILAHLGVK
jgi:hypothetical protein